MITINVNLSIINSIIGNLESSVAVCHQQASELYPNSGYEFLDRESVECQHSLNFFKLTKSLKELDLRYTEIESEIEYFESRIAQLENFLYKSAEQHTPDLMNAIADIHFKLVEKKYQKHKCINEMFSIDVPDPVIENLKNQGLIAVS